jgi:ribosome-associated toxin RatA of RatAB toxin-antitoxin module
MRRRLATVVLFAAALALPSATALARPSLDPDRLAQLAQYEVLVFGDPHQRGLERGKAIGVIDATPEEVFRVATDYAKWKDYLPRVRGSRVVSASGRITIVELVAELPWPAGRREVVAQYTAERLPGEIYRIRFEMMHGEMREYVGSIYIEPWQPGPNPTKTAITYELVADPDVLAASLTQLNRSIRRSAGGFVHALRQRINDLHRLGYLRPLPPPPPARPTAPLAPPLNPRDLKASADKR